MCKTWKLSIKPDNSKGYIPFEVCRQNSFIGVGWAGAYQEKHPADLDEAKKLVIAKYSKWPYPIKYLLEDMEVGNHVWIHQGGKYYLCKAESELKFGKEITEEFFNNDLGHARKATWVEIPEQFVSGTVQRGTIAQRMIQRIYLTEKEFEYHEILFKNLISNPDWHPEIDSIELNNRISGMDMVDLFGLMSPDDFEDAVAGYLQTKGCMLLKSTCFRSKPVFEFSMLSKNHATCHVQVKSGHYPSQLSPSTYTEFAKEDIKIFLFSSHQIPYPGEPQENIIPISHKELYAWLTTNIWAIPMSLKMRLWIFLADRGRY